MVQVSINGIHHLWLVILHQHPNIELCPLISITIVTRHAPTQTHITESWYLYNTWLISLLSLLVLISKINTSKIYCSLYCIALPHYELFTHNFTYYDFINLIMCQQASKFMVHPPSTWSLASRLSTSLDKGVRTGKVRKSHLREVRTRQTNSERISKIKDLLTI